MYQPEIGRWGAIDLFAEVENDVSPYIYVRNNPVKHIDIEGHYWGDQKEADALLKSVIIKLLALATEKDNLSMKNTDGMSAKELKQHNRELKNLDRRVNQLTHLLGIYLH